jgi:hypothetical protein
MKIEPALAEQIYEVAVDMRDRDFQEIAALNAVADKEELAQLLARKYIGNPDVLCASLNGKPICIGGFLPTRQNVISLMMFATEDFPKIGLALTRFIKRQMFPRLDRAGVHRIEALSLSGYDEIHAWLRTLGLAEDGGVMRAFGKNREDFQFFARITDARPIGS